MKKISALILSLGVIAVAHAADYDTIQTSPLMNQNAAINDHDLSSQIHDRLSGSWFGKGFDTVTFKVVNGEVTLQGSVPSTADKEKLEKDIRNIRGVRSLDSQLSVQIHDSRNARAASDFSQDTGATSADKQLNAKIRDNVSTGYLWNNYKDVTLNTANGTVTLQGAVDTSRDQQTLIDAIQQIEGVKAVRSNLRFAH